MGRYLAILSAFILLSVGIFETFSCALPPGSPSNAQVFLYLTNSSGCTVIATMDNSNPVTVTSGSGGPYTLYTSVVTGNHSFGLKGPNASSACNYDITGANQNMTLNNPCSAITGNTGFALSCN